MPRKDKTPPFAAPGVHHATINGHRFHLRPTSAGALLWLDGRQPPYLLDPTARDFGVRPAPLGGQAHPHEAPVLRVGDALHQFLLDQAVRWRWRWRAAWQITDGRSQMGTAGDGAASWI